MEEIEITIQLDHACIMLGAIQNALQQANFRADGAEESLIVMHTTEPFGWPKDEIWPKIPVKRVEIVWMNGENDKTISRRVADAVDVDWRNCC